MKKLAVLLSMALLAACGGGSSDTTTSQQGSDPGASQTASLTINVQEPTSKQVMSYVTPPLDYAKHMRRVVITNPTLGIQNFSATQDDYEKGVTTPTPFTLPIAPGYTIEILDYDKTGTVFSDFTTHGRTYAGYDRPNSPYTLVNYGKATFPINAGANTVTVTMAPITIPSITPPVSITGSLNGSTTFTASATMPASGPFDATSTWSLLGGYSSTISSLSAIQTGSGTSITATSPSPYFGGTFKSLYYLAGKFYVKSSLTKSGDGVNLVVTSTVAVSSPLTYGSGTITPP